MIFLRKHLEDIVFFIICASVLILEYYYEEPELLHATMGIAVGYVINVGIKHVEKKEEPRE